MHCDELSRGKNKTVNKQNPWNTEKYKWKCFNILKMLPIHLILVSNIRHGKAVGQKHNEKCYKNIIQFWLFYLVFMNDLYKDSFYS